MRQCEKNIYCRVGQATDDNLAHTYPILDN